MQAASVYILQSRYESYAFSFYQGNHDEENILKWDRE